MTVIWRRECYICRKATDFTNFYFAITGAPIRLARGGETFAAQTVRYASGGFSHIWAGIGELTQRITLTRTRDAAAQRARYGIYNQTRKVPPTGSILFISTMLSSIHPIAGKESRDGRGKQDAKPLPHRWRLTRPWRCIRRCY